MTATRQLNEAWQREVRRTVELMEGVQGEARIRQPLDATLGDQTRRALELEFASGNTDWQETENGYRLDVEGGYVEYLIEERALELVAVLEDSVQVKGEESRTLEGTITEEISETGAGNYYDDGYGGRTEAAGRLEAEKEASRKLEIRARQMQEEAARQAEQESQEQIEAVAREKARERLSQVSAERNAELQAQARKNLDTVGLRGRQAFHRVLAQGYKNALLSWARANGADNISCQEGTGDTLDIEFTISR